MQWEIGIIEYIQSLQNGFFDVFFYVFSFFASIVGALIVYIFLYFFSNKKYANCFGFTVIFNVILNYILKIIINRPRPYEISDSIINTAQALGKSFPSGHMVCATTISVFLIFFILKNCKQINKKTIYIFAIILYLIFVAISRMYLGQHFATDLLAGGLVGFILSFLSIKYYFKFIKSNNKKI